MTQISKNISKEFAQLLFQSKASVVTKNEILELLPHLDEGEIDRIYRILKTEHLQQKRTGFEIKIDIENTQK